MLKRYMPVSQFRNLVSGVAFDEEMRKVAVVFLSIGAGRHDNRKIFPVRYLHATVFSIGRRVFNQYCAHILISWHQEICWQMLRTLFLPSSRSVEDLFLLILPFPY